MPLPTNGWHKDLDALETLQQTMFTMPTQCNRWHSAVHTLAPVEMTRLLECGICQHLVKPKTSSPAVLYHGIFCPDDTTCRICGVQTPADVNRKSACTQTDGHA